MATRSTTFAARAWMSIANDTPAGLSVVVTIGIFFALLLPSLDFFREVRITDFLTGGFDVTVTNDPVAGVVGEYDGSAHRQTRRRGRDIGREEKLRRDAVRAPNSWERFRILLEVVDQQRNVVEIADHSVVDKARVRIL